MAGLNIAMINGIRPMSGSGDGITEYAYNMYLQLSKKNSVDLLYSIERAKKNDTLGLMKVNSGLSSKARAAAKESHDIFHIVNQEVGFAAKDIKAVNSLNRVVTTIHDVSRFEKGLHRGVLQNAYNALIRRSVKNAIRSSDFLIFDSSQTMEEVKKRFAIGHGAVVNIGIDSRFSNKIPARRDRHFTVGYLGSFAYHKNVEVILRAARLLKDAKIDFRIYGAGIENRNLLDFIDKNNLKRVGMMGFAPEAKKAQVYDGFDAFVFPSLYEGFGLPILEAQARGVPVIIYRHGKIPREVRKYCFEAEDEEHMAMIIKTLKENGYNEKIRRAATAYARGFTWEKCAKETSRIYKKLVG